MNLVVRLILTVVVIVAGLVSIVGLVFLTKFAFNSKAIPNPKTGKNAGYCVKMTLPEKRIAQTAVVLMWMQIILPMLLGLWMIGLWVTGR
jgi:hypothetical protein